MPYYHRRTCPICGKQDLLKLSNHLAQVHRSSSAERTSWLKSALFTPSAPYMTSYPRTLPTRENKCPLETSQNKCLLKTVNCLETQAYPEFKFQHMFSMMVVGPSQSGKTYFVQQLLTKNCIDYPEKKPLRVYWFYNQWQPSYDDIQRALKKKIQFTQGIPELSDDLHEIRPENNNILVFDDLMSQATDSPVISRLFTQGRHGNASVILLLQNMFPKGKFNTDICRNALYKVLFRSPGDHKQIDIMAEQTFAKDRPHFMKAYTQETEKPFGYIVLDNHPRTASHRQVVADVFGQCKSYPCSSTSNTVHSPITESLLEEHRQAKPVVTKQKCYEPAAKKQKTNNEHLYEPAVKKPRKPVKKRKEQNKRQPLKKQEWIEWNDVDNAEEEPDSEKEWIDDGYEEEQPDSEKEWSDHDEEQCQPGYSSRYINLARPPQTGFGPRMTY